ncbi:malonyl-CoA decarboxylase, mitochondrial-like [Athalia rosae]|uniref:malonyl-CoA decarboxylase, mitochondrial-like n=1 Tax=Athalia rosae TaxID=37344 RepID=UPI0020347974|nr:malonyl-CoA decarboxylase, mitochondrial-like [Athalia rosae]
MTRMFCAVSVLARLIPIKRISNNSWRSFRVVLDPTAKGNIPNYIMSAKIGTSNNLTIVNQLEQLFKLRELPNTSNWIIEAKVQALCNTYKGLSQDEKKTFLRTLATGYAVDHKVVHQMAMRLVQDEKQDQRQIISTERILSNSLTPLYQWLFLLTGRLKNGVKFLVDLRTDVLELMLELKDPDETIVAQQLNITLRNLLLQWFSVGFFDLERVTWQSSCEMLEKISEYEMIHPIKNWTDLKRRVGPYRRCYVFTHKAMPGEPVVVLHTALCNTISSTVKEIVKSEPETPAEESKNVSFGQEDKSKIRAAVFYSVASTQKGLQGIELGNYLIKNVAAKVLEEFPQIDQLSSLSPIPNYRTWLLERIKHDASEMITSKERDAIENLLPNTDIYSAMKKILSNSLWMNDKEIVETLKTPLLRACARYLYKEKRRNYALNNVANFHLRNGAVMWRINWLADPSPRGAANSCGIMVNYRYYLHETETNSRNYLERYVIKASEDVVHLAAESEKLFQKSRL